MGNPEFALPSLKMVLASNHELVGVISNPPKPMGRKRILKYTAIGEFAISNGLNLIELDVFDNNCFEKLKSLNADIFIVVAFRNSQKNFYLFQIFVQLIYMVHFYLNIEELHQFSGH